MSANAIPEAVCHAFRDARRQARLMHDSGQKEVVVLPPATWAALCDALTSAQQPAAVNALWACGFCGATYRLDALCCDAQREFRATQHQEPKR